MGLTFTTIDVNSALAGIRAQHDKPITDLEGNIKKETDKKKKAELEKTLKLKQSNRSKAIAQKLVELQTLNAKEAIKMFEKFQSAFIIANQMTGKGKAAFEALKKDPAGRHHVMSIATCLNQIKHLPDELDTDAKAFVTAQGGLRSDGCMKDVADGDRNGFRTLRNKLIGDNKTATTKKDGVHKAVELLENLYETADAFCVRFAKTNDQLRDKVKGQLEELKVETDKLGTEVTVVPNKCNNVISNKDKTDKPSLTANIAIVNEAIFQDKKARTAIKTITTKYNALSSLVGKLTGSSELRQSYKEIGMTIDRLNKEIKDSEAPMKQALTIMANMKKKLK